MIMYLPDNDIHFVVTTNNGTMGIELPEVLRAILVKK